MLQRAMLRRLCAIGVTVVVSVTTLAIAQQPASATELRSGCITKDHQRQHGGRLDYWLRTEYHRLCPQDIFVELCDEAILFNGQEQEVGNLGNVISCTWEPDGEIVEEYRGRHRVGSVKRNCAPNVIEPHVVGETTFGRTKLDLDGRYEGSSWTVHAKVLDAIKGSYGQKYGHIYLDADGHTVEVTEKYAVKPGEVGAYHFTPKYASLSGTLTLKTYGIDYGLNPNARWRTNIRHEFIATANIDVTAPAVLPNGEWDGKGEYVVVETCDGGDGDDSPSPSPGPSPGPSPAPESPSPGSGSDSIVDGIGNDPDGAFSDGMSKCLEKGFFDAERVSAPIPFESDQGDTMYRQRVQCLT